MDVQIRENQIAITRDIWFVVRIYFSILTAFQIIYRRTAVWLINNNWKLFRSKKSWFCRGTIPPFVWRDWEKPRRTSDRLQRDRCTSCWVKRICKLSLHHVTPVWLVSSEQEVTQQMDQGRKGKELRVSLLLLFLGSLHRALLNTSVKYRKHIFLNQWVSSHWWHFTVSWMERRLLKIKKKNPLILKITKCT